MSVKILLLLWLNIVALSVRLLATSMFDGGIGMPSRCPRPGQSFDEDFSSQHYGAAELREIMMHDSLRCPMVRKVSIVEDACKGLLAAFNNIEQLHVSRCVVDRAVIDVLSVMPLKTLTMFHCRDVASVISRLPKTIEDLSIGWYGWKGVLSSLRLILDLPCLRILWLTDCDGIDLRSGLPRDLQVLYITSCKGALLPECLPPRLTRVTLSDCALNAIPPQVLALPYLKYLDVSGNAIPEQEVHNAGGERVEVTWIAPVVELKV